MRKSSSFLNGKKREELLDLLGTDLKKLVQGGMEQFVGETAQFMLNLLMQLEARELCGRWNSRPGNRRMTRWGTEKKATAIINGAKRQIERPRVRILRSPNGEVELESYKAMNRTELLDGPLMVAILSGVPARQYARIVSRGLEAKGVKRSAISRQAIESTKPLVDEFLRKRLDQHDLVVLILDGVHIGKKQVVCAMGIDMNGRKHPLGLHVGATENDIVCRDLIRDLVERGLSTSKEYLFVTDGSKALASAIRAAFGQNVAIQRCQEHKIRDVQAYLPVKLRAEFRAKLQAAYNQRTEGTALKRLDHIRLQLSIISENAVKSLTEGLYETLTLHRLGITGLLRKSLRTTNIIESAFSSVRRYMGTNNTFKNEAQLKLRATRSLLEAEKHFRTLRGARQLRKLRDALASRDQGEKEDV
jgi:putative transposase